VGAPRKAAHCWTFRYCHAGDGAGGRVTHAEIQAWINNLSADPEVRCRKTGISPHALRHTAGSLASASGASIVTVQKPLGHLKATTALNIYAHQLPDDFDKLAAAMDAAARGE
jgi:integrase